MALTLVHGIPACSTIYLTKELVPNIIKKTAFRESRSEAPLYNTRNESVKDSQNDTLKLTVDNIVNWNISHCILTRIGRLSFSNYLRKYIILLGFQLLHCTWGFCDKTDLSKLLLRTCRTDANHVVSVNKLILTSSIAGSHILMYLPL